MSEHTDDKTHGPRGGSKRRSPSKRRKPLDLHEPPESNRDTAAPEQPIQLNGSTAPPEQPIELNGNSVIPERPLEFLREPPEQPPERNWDAAAPEQPVQLNGNTARPEQPLEFNGDSVSPERPPEVREAPTVSRQPIEINGSSAPPKQSIKLPSSITSNGTLPTTPWFRRPWAIPIWAALFVLSATLGTTYLLDAISQETTDNAFIDAHVAQVAPKVAGRVARVRVDDNQHVQLGAVLLELEPHDYMAVLQQKRAAVQNVQAKRSVAETTYEEAQARLATLDANIAATRAESISAEANARRAEDDLNRTRRLTKSGSASQQDLQHAITSEEASKANLEASKKKVAAAEAQRVEYQAAVASAKAQIDAVAAEIEQAKAAETAAQLDLAYTSITAPVAGRVTNRSVAPGNYVQTGQTLLAIVPAQLWVTANFKETQLTSMRPGQPVIITIDAYPGRRFLGHVDSIQRGSGAQFSLLPPENATGNYVKVVQRVPVKIRFDDPLPTTTPLGPGMSVVPIVTVRGILFRNEIIALVDLLSVILAATGVWYLMRGGKSPVRPSGPARKGQAHPAIPPVNNGTCPTRRDARTKPESAEN